MAADLRAEKAVQYAEIILRDFSKPHEACLVALGIVGYVFEKTGTRLDVEAIHKMLSAFPGVEATKRCATG
jgi:hypothetical protein